MTRLHELRVTGLAGRKRALNIEFNPTVNVLWGLNGTGKTSALKIIHSALSNDVTSLANVPFTSATVVFESADDERLYTRTLKKTDLAKQARDFQVFYPNSVFETLDPEEAHVLRRSTRHGEGPSLWKTQPETRSHDLSFHHTYLNISRISEGVRRATPSSYTQLMDEAEYDQLFADQVQAIWRRYNTESLERIRRVQDRGIADVLSATLAGRTSIKASASVQFATLPEDLAYGLVKDFFARGRLNLRSGSFEDFRRNYRDDRFLQQVVGLIFEVQREIDAVLAPQRKLRDLISDLFIGSKSVILEGRRLEIHSGKEALPLQSLSSGEKQMLRLLIETIAADDNSVLVDEPEISLHVDWQHRLVDSLQTVNPRAQLILATHSPEVMATLSDAQIHQL